MRWNYKMYTPLLWVKEIKLDSTLLTAVLSYIPYKANKMFTGNYFH